MPLNLDVFCSFSPEKKSEGRSRPIWLVTLDALAGEVGFLESEDWAWAKASGFEAASGALCLLPGTGGQIKGVLLGCGERLPEESDRLFAAPAANLPGGLYHFENLPKELTASAFYGWLMGAYRFDLYKKATKLDPTIAAEQGRIACLMLPDGFAPQESLDLAEATILVRDMVNTPAEDMGPAKIEAIARGLADRFGAQFSVVRGDDLLAANYPSVHAVGRAASPEHSPRLIELAWAPDEADAMSAAMPSVALVGKGVCFDSGGLDIKGASGMRHMKKDMGGAAHALALAFLIMAAGLRIRLRLVIPAVENAISGNAFRPGDILKTRQGLSVEIGNTDAEGRLILADALTRASEEKPDILLDFATLTGAARVALGPDLPASFTNDDQLWQNLEKQGRKIGDPLWRLPLWAPYKDSLNSPVADIANAGDGGFAGSITAALYLQNFVGADISWAHFDLFAWAPTAKPGRPMGGHAQAIFACFAAIKERFSLA